MKNNTIYIAAWKFEPNCNSSCMWHYGVKDQKRGVRRYQNPDGTWTELGKERRRLAYQKQKRIIRETVTGHVSIPQKYKPYAILDHKRDNGMVDKRTFYDENGLKVQDIHTTDHGNPKEHPYGKHGEHIHVYEWDGTKEIINETRRELTPAERKKNGDIL